MNGAAMSPLVQLILGLAPWLVQQIKDAHNAANPDAPQLTGPEIVAGLEELVTNTLAKDQLRRIALEAEIAGTTPTP